jgi:hypothetical protein
MLGCHSAEQGCFFSGQNARVGETAEQDFLGELAEFSEGLTRRAFDDIATLPRKKNIPARRNPLGQCTVGKN